VDGELVGGCDIMTEMFDSGELKKLIDESAAKRTQA
jgi:monothiol glutaredoxin